MKVEYDKKTDAKYIYFKKGKVDKTTEFYDWLFIDYSKKGDVLGLEILDSSEHQISVSTIGDELLSFFEIKSEIIKNNVDLNIPQQNSAELSIPKDKLEYCYQPLQK